MRDQVRFIRFYIYYLLKYNPLKFVFILGIAPILFGIYSIIDVKTTKTNNHKDFNVVWIDTTQKKFVYTENGIINYYDGYHNSKNYKFNPNTMKISLDWETVDISGDVFKTIMFVLFIICIAIMVIVIFVEWGNEEIYFFEHRNVYIDSLEKCIKVYEDGQNKYYVIFNKLVSSCLINDRVRFDDVASTYRHQSFSLKKWEGTTQDQRDKKLNQILK